MTEKEKQEKANEYQDKIKALSEEYGLEIYATAELKQSMDTGIIGFIPVLAIRETVKE